MKKLLILLVLLVLVCLMSGCTRAKMDDNGNVIEKIQAIITWGSNGCERVLVKDYIRISNGWIQINAVDGRTFSTNERNVLIIKNGDVSP